MLEGFCEFYVTKHVVTGDWFFNPFQTIGKVAFEMFLGFINPPVLVCINHQVGFHAYCVAHEGQSGDVMILIETNFQFERIKALRLKAVDGLKNLFVA